MTGARYSSGMQIRPVNDIQSNTTEENHMRFDHDKEHTDRG